MRAAPTQALGERLELRRRVVAISPIGLELLPLGLAQTSPVMGDTRAMRQQHIDGRPPR